MPAGQLDFLLRHIRHIVGPPTDSADDARLAEDFAARGNEGAFAALVGRHGPMVLGVCRRLLGNDHDAEDAFQAVFLVLARKAPALGGFRSVAGWLHEVAVRTALKARTARDRRRFHERRAAVMVTTDATPCDVDDLRPILDEELARLPEKYRLPMLLCDLQGLTHGQTAAEVGCPVGSVSWRLARGRELLRRRLVKRGVTITAAALAGVLGERSAAPLTAALVKATVGAGVAFAGGSAAELPVAGALAEEVLKSMVLGKTRGFALVGLALTALALGGGLLAYQPRPEQQPAKEAITPDRGKAPTDLQGDSLPAGALLRLGTLRWRLTGEVQFLEYSPDGKVLAVAEWGGLTLWDTVTGKPLARPIGRNAYVHALAFAPVGKTLALVAGDFPSGKGIRNLNEESWHVRLIEIPSGKEIRHFAPQKIATKSLAFTADGKLLAIGGEEGEVLLCDPATGAVRGRCLGARQPVVRLAFSANGRRLAAGYRNGIQVWDIGRPNAAGEVALKESSQPDKDKFDAPLALGFTADERSLIAVDVDGHCRTWDAATGKLRVQFPDPKDHFLDLKAAALSRDGARVVLAGNYVENWPAVLETATGKEVTHGPARGPHPRALQFSPDGNTLAAYAGGETLRFWDARTGKELNRAAGHTGLIRGVDLSADGRTAVTSANDCTAAVWDARTGERRHVLEHPYEPYAVALAPDGKSLVTGASDGWVRFWDTATGKKLFEAKDGGCVYSLAYSPDGRLVVCGAFHGASLIDAASGRILHRLLPDDKPPVAHIAFSADGRTIATAAGHWGRDETGRLVDIWEANGGKHLRRIEASSIVRLLSCSTDGSLIITDLGSSRVTWDTRTGARLRASPYPRELIPMAASPDGRTLAALFEGGLILAERASGGQRRAFRGHTGEIVSVRFNRDGRRLISGGVDTTALVWDVTGGRPKRADLSSKELTARWEALAADDAGRAFDALWDLAGAPGTVPFLRERIKPIMAPDPERLARLMAELDAEFFEVREAASGELARLGELAEPALVSLLAGQPSAEVRKRAEGLLKNLREPADGRSTGEALRQVRAVEVLEMIGTAEAREQLGLLGKGAPAATLTREAQEALGRLGHPTGQ